VEEQEMSMRVPLVASLVVLTTLAGRGFGQQDLSHYLTEKDGRKVLKEPITLQEYQEGIAGRSGTVWTIEPSGEWRVGRSRLNRDGSERVTPIRSGTLSSDELEALAKVLSAQNLAAMPEKTGHEAKINPHWITLKTGSLSSTGRKPQGSTGYPREET
jgi:hypothetical protein